MLACLRPSLVCLGPTSHANNGHGAQQRVLVKAQVACLVPATLPAEDTEPSNEEAPDSAVAASV